MMMVMMMMMMMMMVMMMMMAYILTLAYSANLLTVLLLPQYEAPIDSNQDLVLAGTAPR